MSLKKFGYYCVSEFDDLYENRFDNQKMRTWFDKYRLIKVLLGIDSKPEIIYNLTSRLREFNWTTSVDKSQEEYDIAINDFLIHIFLVLLKTIKTLYRWKEYIHHSFIIIPIPLSKPKTNDETPKPKDYHMMQ